MAMLEDADNERLAALLRDEDDDHDDRDRVRDQAEHPLRAAVRRVWKGSKQLLRIVSSSLSEDNSTWQHVVIAVVEMLQILSFVFPSDNGLALDSTVLYNTAVALSAFNGGFLSDDVRQPASFAILLAIVCGLVIFGTRLLQHSSPSMSLDWKRDVQIVRTMLVISSTLAPVPIIDSFLRPFAMNDSSAMSYIGVLIAMPAMVAFGILVKVAVGTYDPRSSWFWTRSHCRFDTMQFVLRVAVVIIFRAASVTVGVFVCLPGILVQAYAFAMLGPYSTPVASRVASVSSLVLAWAFICRCFLVVSRESTAMQVFLISVPFIVGAAFFLDRIRSRTIMATPSMFLRNSFEVQQRVNLLLAPARARQMSDDERSTLLDSAQSLLAQTTTRFSTSSILHVFHAMFHLHYKNNLFMALSSLDTADSLNAAPDVSYMIESLRLDIEDIVSGTPEALANKNFVAFMANLDSAVALDRVATANQSKFWELVLNGVLTQEATLQQIGAASARSAIETAMRYMRCLQLCPDSVTVLSLMGGFSRDIVHDVASAQRFMDTADKCRRAELEHSASHSSDFSGKRYVRNLFCESNPVVVVSGHPAQLGRITDCNYAALSVFGYADKRALVGRNIAILIPPPLSALHGSIMAANLTSGRTSFTGKTQLVYTVTALGYLVPVHLFVSRVWGGDGHMAFVAAMTRVEEAVGDIGVAIISEESVVAVSLGFATFFGVDNDALRNGTLVDVTKLVPSFAKAKESILRPTGHRCPVVPLKQSDDASGNNSTIVHLCATLLEVSGHCSLVLLRARHLAGLEGHVIHSASTSPRRETRVGRSQSASRAFNLVLSDDGGDHTVDVAVATEAMRPGRPGDTPTVATGTSAASSVTSNPLVVIVSRVRQRFMQQTAATESALGDSAQRRLTSRLQRFQTLFRLTVLCILALAVTTYAVTSVLLSNFTGQVTFMTDAGAQRRLATAEIADALHRLLVADRGLPTADNQLEQTLTMASSATSLSQASAAFYAQRASLTNDQLALLGTKQVAVSLRLLDGTSANVNYTLMDVGLLTVAATRLVLLLNSTTLVPSDPNVAFALNSQPIVDAYHDSTMMLQLQAQALYPGANVVTSALSIFAVVIIVVLVWAIVRPTIARISRNQSAIVQMFRAIPRAAADRQWRRCLARTELHDDLARNGLRDSNRLRDYFDEKGAGDDATTADSRSKNQIDTDDLADAADDGSRHQERRRWWSAGTAKSVAKAAVGFVLCIAYFLAAYLTGFNAVRETIIYKPAECNWASYRQSAAIKVVLLLRMQATAGVFNGGANISSAVTSAINDFEQVHSALMYGSTALHTPAYSSVYNLQDYIMTQNGCTPPSSSDCTAYDNHVMLNGANAAINEMIAQAQEASSAIRAICNPCVTQSQMAAALSVQPLNITNTLYAYLAPTLRASVDLYVQAVQSQLGTMFRTTALALLFSFVVVLALAMVFVYQPMIVSIDRDVQDTQGMLLMVPEETYAGAGRLVAYVAEHQKALEI
ncbi:hypothetical protein PBRA_003814 [Plasmodiophora brassicae]|uniref:TmcB/TmcC TPR repeats domain-containing protein n=1 Tax=Plasmodiophora brassicae TaxID=37360 RepID=A0A0G4IIP9_PLABS|nr:hypothetical protein PBRA_003814 [Plasmodiophora brassicae]